MRMRTRGIWLRYFCGLFTASFIVLNASTTSAAPFSLTVDCPTTVVGPVTVLNQTIGQAVNLTLNVPSTVGILPINALTRIDDNAAAPGIYTGTLSCTFTANSVTVPFTRSFSLEVPPAGPTGTGLMTTGAVSFSVNLGPENGVLRVSAPVDQHPGFDRALPNGGTLLVPFAQDTMLLLTQDPSQIPTLSAWGVMTMLAVLLGLGLLFLRRGLIKRA